MSATLTRFGVAMVIRAVGIPGPCARFPAESRPNEREVEEQNPAEIAIRLKRGEL